MCKLVFQARLFNSIIRQRPRFHLTSHKNHPLRVTITALPHSSRPYLAGTAGTVLQRQPHSVSTLLTKVPTPCISAINVHPQPMTAAGNLDSRGYQTRRSAVAFSSFCSCDALSGVPPPSFYLPVRPLDSAKVGEWLVNPIGYVRQYRIDDLASVYDLCNKIIKKQNYIYRTHKCTPHSAP